MRIQPLTLAVLALAATGLTSCAPVVLGGAATAAYVGLQDRPVGQTAEDTKIKVAIKDKLTNANFAYLTDVGIDVFYGDVLLTGIVPDTQSGEQVLELVRSTGGVKKVYNELFVGARYTARQKAQDAWIAAQLQPRLLMAEDSYPLNYIMSTVNGHVYIIGSVGSSAEHEHTLHVLRTTRGVVQVHDYLTIANPSASGTPGAPASGGAAAVAPKTTGSMRVGNTIYQTHSPDPLEAVDLE
jgi:osmotically-inducible protein OsmY